MTEGNKRQPEITELELNKETLQDLAEHESEHARGGWILWGGGIQFATRFATCLCDNGGGYGDATPRTADDGGE